MPVAAATKSFLQDSVTTIPGWLTDAAAMLTARLATEQLARGQAKGGVFEIGVYAGRYLSLLYHLFPGEPVTGVDIFRAVSTKDVTAHFARVFGDAGRLNLARHDSRELSVENTLEILAGKRPHFISIDGDHSGDAVAHDLALAADVLAEGGLIAVDDYLNPVALGVHEGVCRYFYGANNGRLRPFCLCGNKLFLSEAKDQELWRSVAYGFAAEEPELPSCAAFEANRAKGECYVQQTLHGAPVVIH